MLKLKAPAKVNLVLEVLGRREDGYHDIKSIIQTISLYDELDIDRAGEIKLICSVPELETENNLVLKAARILRQAAGCAGGATIRLDKNIPSAAGLGGGSSDAAATLLGLNRLWSLGYSREKLAELAASIGSDVPFFIYGGTCLAEGRGEKILKLPYIGRTWFVLIKPQVTSPAAKTGKMYSLINGRHYSAGQYIQGVMQLVKGGLSIGDARLFNVFDSVAETAFPEIGKYVDIFRKAGAEEIHLAGSGPVLYTVVSDEDKAAAINAHLAGENIQTYLACSIDEVGIGY